MPKTRPSNGDGPAIHWFPGHMAKTRRLITANLKQVDLVVELTDARTPLSARNPELQRWVAGKPHILILNKCDYADEQATARWLAYFKRRGIPAIACDCRSGNGVGQFMPLYRQVLSDLLERRKAKGMAGLMTRMMVVGIPNVGKSSFINRMAGGRKAKVEDRPGVTVNKQWVRLSQELELLDMPGVLWPKFEDADVAERLAFTGAVKDQIVDLEWLCAKLLAWLAKEYPTRLTERYRITIPEEIDGFALLEDVARARGMLLSGGVPNTERAAIAVLDEFRAGKLGRITLELPEEQA